MQICTPQPKKSPKKPNQKWTKCCMKATIRQVILKTSLFIVHLSKIYLKTPLWTFYEKSAPNGRICCFCEISFKRSINQLLDYRDLTKTTVPKLLTNFTFMLQRISEWQLLMIFCYTELLFPKHSESDRAQISSRTSRSEFLEKFFLEIIRNRKRRQQYPGRQRSSLRSK